MRELSHKKRLYVYDLEEDRIIAAHHVAHGAGSSQITNPDRAMYFSNKPGSKMTSVGPMMTGETFIGSHGYSLKLYGLADENSNVEKRGICIHDASYMSTPYILKHGRCGQSHGGLAVNNWINVKLIDMIKNGVFVYVYY